METASWVIRRKSNREVIAETWQKSVVDKLNTDVYEAIPVLDHLVDINLAIKAGYLGS